MAKKTTSPVSPAHDGVVVADATATLVESPKGLKVASSKEDAPRYGRVDVVTPMRLKRREVVNPYYMKAQVPEDVYLGLNIIGMKLGVTWDEALRGILELNATSSDHTILRDFCPALN